MATIDNEVLQQLLDKEAQGVLTPQEQQWLDEWYHSFDSTQKDLQVFRNTAHEQQVGERLLQRILKAGFSEEAIPIQRGRNSKWWQWSAAAAAVLVIVFSAVVWKRQVVPQPSIQQQEAWLSFQAGQGQLQHMTLEDGSEVWLNAGSLLRYPKHFDRQHREVYVEGEAYFNIAQEPGRPFAVRTDSLTTQVLGTAFTVTAYKHMPVQAVTVMNGKVQVMHSTRALGSLTADKRMTYNILNGKIDMSEVDATSLMSWKDGRLQFEDQDMEDIAARLERWYGYSFVFANEQLKHCRYTASFNNSISINELLQIMKEISDIRYRIDAQHQQITLLGTGCNE